MKIIENREMVLDRKLKIKYYKNMSRPTQPVSDKFDFPVSVIELKTPENKLSGIFASRRDDTGDIFSSFTESYGLLKNADLLEMAEDAFKNCKMGAFQRSVNVARKGARMYATYDFKDKIVKIPKVGDKMGFRLTVHNSYDCSCPLFLSGGGLRLVCLNGMTRGDDDVQVNKRHFTSLKLELIESAVETAFKRFGSMTEAFGRLAEVPVKQDEGHKILVKLQESGVISDVVREGIAQFWQTPKRLEDQPRTMYGLYNAATEYITHGLRDERFEYSIKLNERVSKIFTSRTKESLLTLAS